MIICAGLLAPTAADATCSGKFMNPLTDICWSCVFPLRFGNAIIMGADQLDNDSSSSNNLVCACGPQWIGVPVGFWEPSHLVDVSTDPYCTPSLGGNIIGNVGLPADAVGTQSSLRSNMGLNYTFYHYTTYRNPILFAMQFLSDNPCIDKSPFDILDFSAVNPTWTDDRLGAIFSPDSFLYGTLATILTGIPVGTCSTFDTGDPLCMNLRRYAHWSVGFNGQTYPLSGALFGTHSTLSAASNIAKKAFTFQHRTMRVWGTSGAAGLCGYYPQLMIDDTDYKISMVFPKSETQPILGRCCQPFGASTLVWGMGSTWPITGEDMSYAVFKKRDCCMAAASVTDP